MKPLCETNPTLRSQPDHLSIEPGKLQTAKAPRGRPPKNLTTRERMMRKLLTKKGKQRYRLRQTTVEPVFGQINWNRGLRQLLVRGLDAAKASWQFECGHNLLKLYTISLQPN